MIDILRARLNQGYRTFAFPDVEPNIVNRFRGRPEINGVACPDGCRQCTSVCPTDAVKFDGGTRIDLGACLFCNACAEACPEAAIKFTNDFRLATDNRAALVTNGDSYERAKALGEEIRRVFGRSLRLRQVSAGGCNACEADINVLSTVVFDLSRYGIQIVASPRHADAIVITGPVTQNMLLGLQKTWNAMPSPRFVMAVGACAISGGPFHRHEQHHNGCESTMPKVDLYVPGCPPHPWTILDGILRLLGERPDHQSPQTPAPATK